MELPKDTDGKFEDGGNIRFNAVTGTNEQFNSVTGKWIPVKESTNNFDWNKPFYKCSSF